MGLIITAYAKDAFRMFRLPNIDNANHTITLDGQTFHAEKNLPIHFSVMNGQWTVLRSRYFSLSCQGKDGFETPLEAGAVFSLTGSNGLFLSLLVMPGINALRAFQKFQLQPNQQLVVGSDSACDVVYDYQGLISKHHLAVTRTEAGTVLTDTSTNGVYVNWHKIDQSYTASYGDCANLFGLCILFLGDTLAIGTLNGTFTLNNLEALPPQESSAEAPSAEDQAVVLWDDEEETDKYYQRAPRNTPTLYTDPIEIEAPPSVQNEDKRPLLLTIGPSFTMALPMLLGTGLVIMAARQSGGGTSAYMYTGIITAASSAILGVVWAVANLRYSKKSGGAYEKLRFERYRAYLVEKAEEIKAQHLHNTVAMQETYPSAEVCCGYCAENKKLWDRNATHADFLAHRLGLGSIPFQVPITIPQKRFSLYDDSLADKPATIYDTYQTLEDVPICIDMMEQRLIGIVGGQQKHWADEVVRTLTIQIAANNCYTDVKLMFLSDKSNSREQIHWDFARWLPHVWSEDHRTRFFATDASGVSEVFYALSNIINIRAEQEESYTSTRSIAKPQYIVFLSDYALLEGEPVSKHLLEPNDSYGVTTFLLADRLTDLPNKCEYIIENTPDGAFLYNTQSISQKKEIKLDTVSLPDAEAFARRLAATQVSELESGGGIPSSLTFFDMYGVHRMEEFHVLERWQKNRTYVNMRSLVGQRAGNQNWYLDINEKYHGPHGLVAGTTGSGKSETLQTYMLSLALNFSPADVAFFIIDFKGGGMANQFTNIPHLAGLISNLSGNQVHRAMVSIKSENRRRQRIFSEYGVNHLDQYTRLVKSGEANIPIPHLLIIIDEFAELKREEPDFMRELISVAQVGRSLGVHMILATQKPSGTVDDNIWSNSKFRLCLRVQDRQDSMDMLHKPDAAYITQAGRCYMQVGNDEIFELFQSGWSGAAYQEGDTGEKGKLVVVISDTGKSLVVGSRTLQKHRAEQQLHWLSRISEVVDQTAQQAGVSLADLTRGNDNLHTLARSVCQNLKQAQLDYGDSAADLKKLEDFILLKANGPADIAALAISAEKRGCSLPEMQEKTQLDAVIEYLGHIARENNLFTPMQLWLPVLSDHILLSDLSGFNEACFQNAAWPAHEGLWELSTPIGLYDDPANQLQEPLTLSFTTGGHTAICGVGLSGKSTLLQTMMYGLMCKYPPNYVSFYCLDFSSKKLACFEGSPHVGGILYENDAEKCGDLFAFIQEILQARKESFHGGDYSQYVRANGVVEPCMIIVIDNYANFFEKTEGAFDDILLSLSREGESYGIFLVITASGFGSTGIPSRIGDNMRTVLSLEMGDKYKYADALRVTRLEMIPEPGVHGRGLAITANGPLEYQVALGVEAEDDYGRAEKIAAQCREMHDTWAGPCAKPIPTIPEEPCWEDLHALDAFSARSADPHALPLAWCEANASLYSLSLPDTFCYLIQGRPRSGKTNVLKVMARAAAEKKAEIVIIDFSSRLKRFADTISARLLTNTDEVFSYCQELMPRIQERNTRKQALLAEGASDSTVFDALQAYPQIYLFIDQFTEFLTAIYDPDEREKNICGFLENVVAKGTLHNLYIAACFNADDYTDVLQYTLFKSFISYQAGLHIGANANAQRVFDFSTISYSQLSKTPKLGVAITPPSVQQPSAFRIVFPYSK